MTEEPFSISVIAPISPAIERVKTVLFRPFDFERWFVIGFCAWLAYLGIGGNPNFNFMRNNHQSVSHVKTFINDNLPFVIIFGIIGVVIAIAIGLLVTWLSSRGRFMFLHCVAENKAQVKLPWSKFKSQADSLFLFRVVVGITGIVAILLPCVFGGVFIYTASCCASGLNLVPLFAAIMVFLMAVVFMIILALIYKFTEDFVVPIMFMSGVKCTQGWRQFRQILFSNKGSFAIYILFQIVIGMAISAIIFAAIFLTCCAACCFLVIPYIGTVLLLPVFVFKRAYSLYFLGQFGPQFDIFSAQTIVG